MCISKHLNCVRVCTRACKRGRTSCAHVPLLFCCKRGGAPARTGSDGKLRKKRKGDTRARARPDILVWAVQTRVPACVHSLLPRSVLILCLYKNTEFRRGENKRLWAFTSSHFMGFISPALSGVKPPIGAQLSTDQAECRFHYEPTILFMFFFFVVAVTQHMCPASFLGNCLRSSRSIVFSTHVIFSLSLSLLLSLSAADNGTIHMWDWRTGYNFQRIHAAVQPGSLDSESGIFACMFDISQTKLITAEADKTIKVYREDTSAVSHQFAVFARSQWSQAAAQRQCFICSCRRRKATQSTGSQRFSKERNFNFCFFFVFFLSHAVPVTVWFLPLPSM